METKLIMVESIIIGIAILTRLTPEEMRAVISFLLPRTPSEKIAARSNDRGIMYERIYGME